MSGICGIVSLDGRPPSQDDIRQVASVLERRGPDGTHVWACETAALGHTLLATTPEALVEQLPFTHAPTGCTITGDARLDNRAELISLLGPGNPRRVIGDDELILLAWLEWGHACLDRLLGDFAFAIWDPRSGRLFCARDQTGMRQLTWYHVPGRLFVFATEPRAILMHPGVKAVLNEQRIADYLADLEPADLTSTFFEGLYRLPPAHYLVVERTGIQCERYWSLEPQPVLELESDEAYVQAFLAVLSEAVRCRLRSAGGLGSMLSGGLDSGAVTALATRILAAEGRGPLMTVSAIGPGEGTCRETRLARLAAAMPGLAPRFVSHADVETWGAAVLELTCESDEPFDGHMTLPRAVYRSAREAGIRILLDGGGGDTLFLPGSWIARLLRQGKWRTALGEIRARRAFWSDEAPLHTIVLRELRKAFVPSWLRTLRGSLRSTLKAGASHRQGPIKAGFAARMGTGARRDAIAHSLSRQELPYPEERVGNVMHANLVVGRERYDRVASALAIEPRDPFMDRRVLEFCASLPGEQLASDGWPKLLLRRAMQDYLPDEICWQRGKQHLGLEFTRALASSFTKECSAVIERHRDQLGHYVESGTLTKLFMAGGATFARDEAQITCSLACWLERFESLLDDGRCSENLKSL